MSDAISSPTGLGRATRELALKVYEHLSETFEVGTLGYNGNTSLRFPWRAQYSILKISGWAVNDLPYVWKDFAGDRRGILMSIWNPSWLTWLADSNRLPGGDLRSMLESKPFERWLYAPIDADGPNGVLTSEVADTLKRFDRVLAYTEWSADLIDRTIYKEGDYRKTNHLPHGIDTNVFYPQDREEARESFVAKVTGQKKAPALKPDTLLIGIVATNSQRKDWGLAMEAAGELVKKKIDVGVWCHTGGMHGHWNIEELAKAYGLAGRVIPSHLVLNDEDLASCYAACDCTWGIGSGEGFGYPLAESLACGVPVIHGRYAGGADFVPSQYLVDPIGFYHDGFYANQRPVFNARDWADLTLQALGSKPQLPKELAWKNLWPKWEKWFLEGVNG